MDDIHKESEVIEKEYDPPPETNSVSDSRILCMGNSISPYFCFGKTAEAFAVFISIS